MKELASRLACLARPLASYLDAIVSWKFQSEGVEKGNAFRNFVSAVVVRRRGTAWFLEEDWAERSASFLIVVTWTL